MATCAIVLRELPKQRAHVVSVPLLPSVHGKAMLGVTFSGRRAVPPAECPPATPDDGTPASPTQSHCLALGATMRSPSILLLVLLLLACSELPTATDVAQVGTPTLGATSNLVRATRPYETEFYNFCTDEWMDISGLIHDGAHSTTLPSGNVRVHYFFNFEAVATGRETGKQYHFVGANSWMWDWLPATGGTVEQGNSNTYMTLGMFVGPGPGDNAYMRWLSHWTQDANGGYTVDFGGWTVECR